MAEKRSKADKAQRQANHLEGKTDSRPKQAPKRPMQQTKPGGPMAEIKVKDGQAYCKKCGRDVVVREEKGDASKDQKPLILVDDQGHVIAERYTTAGAWNRAA